MVKKLKEVAKNEDKQLASAVRTSAQQIWHAGLGAFAKAQEEGGRVFNKLVQEGTDLQKRTRSMAEDRVGDMSDTVSKVADGVSKQAAGSWDKLEQVFEERVARALATIGVPTSKDIAALTRQVEQLAQMVAQLGGRPAPDGKAAGQGPGGAARKAAAKGPAKQAAKGPAKSAAKGVGKSAAKGVARGAADGADASSDQGGARPAVKAARKAAPRKAAAKKAGAAPAGDN
ncbi:MAG: phasin family protein [Pseudomonadota bacterium]|nr:phasin family protein [Pseudomonadota bacterium]